jgi:nifR3 family TIM-barrel protein
MNFWKEIQTKKQPFFCAAPMADVTDAAFRRLLVKYGKPDVVWTEFVSADGLMSPGREVLGRDLVYTEGERPILAQLFSSNPEKMEAAAKHCAELGFDGIDINMGCPDRSIEKQGAGAAMIKTPEIAKAIIKAAKRGIAAAGKDIPVSVKTRVGYNTVQLDEWIPFLLNQDIAALTVHARTRKELSNVPARWDHIRKVVQLRNKIAPHTIIIGNGDVISLADAKEKARESGCDGVMIGRGLFGNPWCFDESRQLVSALPKKQPAWIRNTFLRHFFDTKRVAPQSAVRPVTLEERLEALAEHAGLFEELLGDIKSFAIMKKHFKAYCTGFPGAKELRMELMEAKNAGEVNNIISKFLTK